MCKLVPFGNCHRQREWTIAGEKNACLGSLLYIHVAKEKRNMEWFSVEFNLYLFEMFKIWEIVNWAFWVNRSQPSAVSLYFYSVVECADRIGKRKTWLRSQTPTLTSRASHSLRIRFAFASHSLRIRFAAHFFVRVRNREAVNSLIFEKKLLFRIYV